MGDIKRFRRYWRGIVQVKRAPCRMPFRRSGGLEGEVSIFTFRNVSSDPITGKEEPDGTGTSTCGPGPGAPTAPGT